jgi:hypothetical protein
MDKHISKSLGEHEDSDSEKDNSPNGGKKKW